MSQRAVVAGNNLAGIYTLDLLVESLGPSAVLAIAPKGGQNHDWQPSLAAHAAQSGVRCLEPSDVNAQEIVEVVGNHAPTLLLSVYYTQIFRKGLLDAVNGPVLNFHPSLLPLHRGTAPIIWAIVKGEPVTGLTVHHIDEGIDTGKIIAQHQIPIHPDDSGFTMHMKLAKLVRATAARIIRQYRAGEIISSGQAQSGESSYHSSRDPTVNCIDWSLDCKQIRNIVRALAPPLPGAYTELNGQPLILARLEPVEHPTRSAPKQPGMIELGHEGEPLIWAADGPLRLLEFVHEGLLRPGAELPVCRDVLEGQILR